MNWWFILAAVLAIVIVIVYLIITRLSLGEIRNVSLTEYYQGGG